MQNPQSGIMVGIPTLGRPVPLSWAMTWKSLNAPINYNQVVAIVRNRRVADARNEIAGYAIDQDMKYLFFLGDDTEPPPDTLKQLIYRMEHDKSLGVVGAIYCSKSNPPAPLVFRGDGAGTYWDWKLGEYFQITGLGMDATLIRVDLFRELEQKLGSREFFKTVEEDSFEDDTNHAEMWTEDLYFCKQVRELTEYNIYADGNLICKHHDVYSGAVYDLPHDCYPVTGIKRGKGLKQAVDLGCGGTVCEFGPEYNLTRVDIRDEVQPDYRCDLRKLPFDNESFDIVHSSHVLEHFGRAEITDVLTEWLRILKPDGMFWITVPNVDWAVVHYDEKAMKSHVYNVLYGGQTNDYDFHKSWWSSSVCKEVFEGRFKLHKIDEELDGYNLILKYSKTKPTQKPKTKRKKK